MLEDFVFFILRLRILINHWLSMSVIKLTVIDLQIDDVFVQGIIQSHGGLSFIDQKLRAIIIVRILQGRAASMGHLTVVQSVMPSVEVRL